MIFIIEVISYYNKKELNDTYLVVIIIIEKMKASYNHYLILPYTIYYSKEESNNT